MFPAAGEGLAMSKSHEDRLWIEGNGLVDLGSDVRVIRAQKADLDRVLEILEEASRWLISKGLETQWLPSPAFRQTIRDNIDHGDVYVAKDVKETIGTITLQWSDKKFWGDLPPDAGYIHKLAIKRAHAGQRLGLRLLSWAEAKARADGKSYLRLDCLASNKVIREYYEKAGFVHVRDISAPGWEASLYEKRL
ncbi:GNAT family N-acetyltransferase [Candidatus Bathyarchaeota archaeon]|nr:MAG: GNAT family N-acetyltransferase [Candidatus Bathyarchaeota archaeon]